MLSILGLSGPDWVIMAADSSVSSSITCMGDDFDRLFEIDSRHVFAASGETGDSLQLTEYIQGNIAFYKFNNNVELSSDALSHYIRRILADSVRRSPYEVNSLLAGYDGAPSLYYLDYLGTHQKIPYGAQGYCAYFALSVFDQHVKKDMTLEEGKKVMKLAIDQVTKRFTIAPHGFIVKVIDATGIHKIEL